MPHPPSKVGMILFLIYLALYAGFVIINATAPQMMEQTPIAGLNLAILYGFGLIFAAILLAGLYGFLRRGSNDSSAKDGEGSP